MAEPNKALNVIKTITKKTTSNIRLNPKMEREQAGVKPKSGFNVILAPEATTDSFKKYMN